MLPTAKGTYVLILQLKNAVQITIGKLGTFDFAPGWYAYVGSAFGRGGVNGRLKHHLKPITKPHWHIDYLRMAAPLQEVWYIASEQIYEHDWATQLKSMSGANVPVPRFGASDCKCETHLIAFTHMPDFDTFRELVKMPIQRHLDKLVYNKKS